MRHLDHVDNRIPKSFEQKHAPVPLLSDTTLPLRIHLLRHLDHIDNRIPNRFEQKHSPVPLLSDTTLPLRYIFCYCNNIHLFYLLPRKKVQLADFVVYCFLQPIESGQARGGSRGRCCESPAPC